MLRQTEDADWSLFIPDKEKEEDKEIVEKEKDDCGLFDIIRDIQNDKKGILNEKEILEGKFPNSKYPAFVVNKILGNTADTLMYANEMNRLSHMPVKNQYNFLLQSIPKRRRYGKSYKAVTDRSENISRLMQYYHWGFGEAEQNYHMFTDADFKELERIFNMEG